jgi:hypothetical protein
MPYKDPEAAREYQRDRKRIERAGGRTTHVQPVPLPFRLKTAADVIGLIEEQVGAVRAADDATTLEKARAVGFLAGVALRAIEAGDMAARLEALEAVLKARGAA